MIVQQHPTEALSAADPAIGPANALFGFDQPIAESLMTPLSVIMRKEGDGRALERRLAEVNRLKRPLGDGP